MASSDVFRPRLPIDPFHDALPPWQSESESDSEPHTVLVLGAPTRADLAPLLLSPRLASTLVLIATHTPPPVPAVPQCPILILRLPAPLDIHDAGAVRLVGLLDRAQRVARTWHAAPHAQPRVQQLAELYPGGEFSIAEVPEFALPSDPPQQPAPELRPDSSDTSSLLSTVSSSTSSSSSSVAPTRQGAPAQPLTGQFTFSALINFLPPTLPDKALLKHAILVTTLSAPFLAAQPPLLPYTKHPRIFSSLSLSLSSPRRRSRFVSLFTRQTPPASTASSVFTASTDSLAARPARHAHIVHVLPYSASHPHPHRSSTAPTPAALALNPHRRSITAPTLVPYRSKLAQSIEQFLLSFAYPPSASASAPSLTSLSGLSTPPVPVPVPVSASASVPTGTTHRAAPTRSSPLASPAGSLRTIHTTASASAKRQNPHSASSILGVSPIGAGAGMVMTANAPAVPYLLPAGLLGTCPPGSTRCVGEIVLCGLLDRAAAGAGVGGADGVGGAAVGAGAVGAGGSAIGSGGGGGGGSSSSSVGSAGVKEVIGGWPRAWIGATTEIVVPAMCVGSIAVPVPVPASAPSSPVDSVFAVREDKDGSMIEPLATQSQSQPQPRSKSQSENPNSKLKPTSTSTSTTKSGHLKHKERRTRRNEAGLPTPPESSSSSDDDNDDDGDGVLDSSVSVSASVSVSVSAPASASASPSASASASASATPCDDASDCSTIGDGSGEVTEDTHVSHCSCASVSAPALMGMWGGEGLGRFAGRWARAKAHSEAHVQLGASVGAGAGGRERAEGCETAEGKGKERDRDRNREREGGRVYRFLGGVGKLVRGVRRAVSVGGDGAGAGRGRGRK